MPNRQTALPISTALSLSVICAAFGAVGSGLGSPESVVASGLDSALSRPLVADVDQRRNNRAVALVSGSEAFWLSDATKLAGTQAASWARPLAAGDRIQLGSEGHERTFEIVELRPAASEEARVLGADAAAMVLVTCRDTANPNAQPVRLWLSIDNPLISDGPVLRAL